MNKKDHVIHVAHSGEPDFSMPAKQPSQPTGGQAFPRAAREGVPGNEWEGMTLRDYFAGQALAGAVANGGWDNTSNAEKKLYKLADAMIAARDS